VTETGEDLLQMMVDYARQETLGPLEGIGRYVAFGVAGSVCISLGLVLGLLAGLRALQTETGSTFHGNLSWVPYVIIAAVAFVLLALAAWGVTRGGFRRSAVSPHGSAAETDRRP
jgi:hypothetical protein